MRLIIEVNKELSEVKQQFHTNKGLLDKQQLEFDSKTHELNEKVAALDQFGYKKLYDELLKEKENHQKSPIYQVKKELNASKDDSKSFKNDGSTEQNQELNKMNQHHEELTAMINKQRTEQ